MALAPTPRIGDVGERLDFDIRQGATFGPFEITLLDDETGDPLILAGGTLFGQIRKTTAPGAAVVADLVLTIVDAAAGLFTLGLSAEVTAAMAAGPSASHPDSRYVHDVELHWPDGSVRPLLYGQVFVMAEATRA